MRNNSSIFGGAYNNSIKSQTSFSSIAMSRSQFNSSDLLSNISNVSSLLNYSFGNEMVASGGRINLPRLNVQQQENSGVGVAEIMGCSDSNAIPYTTSSVLIHGQNFQKPSVNQCGLDHPQFQQQLEGLNNMNFGDQNGSVQLISRSLAPIKTENQISEPKILLQQQQQQQQQQQTQHLQLLRQSSQVAAQMSILQQHQQQRLLQQQQQQQIVNNFPLQRSHLQQQIQQQSVSVRPQLKPTGYEPGICARRLTHYMYHQQHRPEDNNIEFWKKFVSEYFAPNARKRWCVSLYGSVRQTTGVFPQDAWHCEICSCKPGRGFETTVEVLPRLCQIKYASGTLEELLYVDMPHEYLNASGQIVLDYAKAIQESVFDQLRVVRNGQLRIVFNQDLKIASWEFCARRHEELIPRRTIIQQVSQLGAAIHKYQAAAQTASNLSTQDLQIACNSFIASARQLAKSLEVPLVNDLGYTKRYVRCLQISEVVNSMKDLIDYSRETGAGPMDSLINFPKRANPSSAPNYQQTQQQYIAQNLNQTNQNSPHPKGIQNALCNSALGANNSIASTVSISASTPSINSILLQNSINSKQDYPLSTLNSPYGNGNTVQISSASSSSLPSSSNNNPAPPPSHFSSRNSFSNSPATHQSDPSDSQSSSQQTLHEMLISSSENELKVVGGTARGGLTGSLEFDGMSGGFTSTVLEAGMRVGFGSNAMPVSGRIGISNISQNLVGMSHYQQQDMGSRLLGTLGAAGQWLQ